MNDIICSIPPAYPSIEAATRDAGFTMASDIQACSLLKTLAAVKPAGRFLELGTGTGLSTAWILAGMNQAATLISIDNDAGCLSVARKYLGHDLRLTLIETDGGEWVAGNCGQKFDYIFADTWHGKYLLLAEVLAMLNPGGFYIIDDMLPQPNWMDGHAQKATKLFRSFKASIRPDNYWIGLGDGHRDRR